MKCYFSIYLGDHNFFFGSLNALNNVNTFPFKIFGMNSIYSYIFHLFLYFTSKLYFSRFIILHQYSEIIMVFPFLCTCYLNVIQRYSGFLKIIWKHSSLGYGSISLNNNTHIFSLTMQKNNVWNCVDMTVSGGWAMIVFVIFL